MLRQSYRQRIYDLIQNEYRKFVKGSKMNEANKKKFDRLIKLYNRAY